MYLTLKQRLNIRTLFGKKEPKTLIEHIDTYLDVYNKYKQSISNAWLKAGLLFVIHPQLGIDIRRIESSSKMDELEERYLTLLTKAKHELGSVLDNIKEHIKKDPLACISIQSAHLRHPGLEHIFTIAQNKVKFVLGNNIINGYVTRIASRNSNADKLIVVEEGGPSAATQNTTASIGYTVFVLNKQADGMYSGKKIEMLAYPTTIYSIIRDLQKDMTSGLKSALGREIKSISDVSPISVSALDSYVNGFNLCP